jgi:hypothetical protein
LSPKFNLNNFSLFASSPSLFIQKNWNKDLFKWFIWYLKEGWVKDFAT